MAHHALIVGATGLAGSNLAEHSGEPEPLEIRMAESAPISDRVVAQPDLRANPLSKVASFRHMDADLGRQVETFNDMARSRKLGFLDNQDTTVSFTDAFDRLRADRIIRSRLERRHD